MDQYLNTVHDVLETGMYKPNRTGVDTISNFSQTYTIDVSDGYPLLTTKKMDGFRWDSMLHEFVWYMTGEHHIRDFSEKSGIWDAWADDDMNLATAYGRFWRRFPVPEPDGQLPGETWVGPTNEHRWTDDDDIDASRWVNEEDNGQFTFDQIQYVIDMLNENPNSRRLVVNAWNPGNAAVSTLPPCHFTFVFNVQGDKLNVHLTQRSADLALGVPFNIACYALMLKVIAQQTGFEAGVFSHTLVDAHVYCGDGERGEWYRDNLDDLQTHLSSVEGREDYMAIKEWVEHSAPGDNEDLYDHIPGLLDQMSRKPMGRCELEIADKTVGELTYDDFTLHDYVSYNGIRFGVAE